MSSSYNPGGVKKDEEEELDLFLDPGEEISSDEDEEEEGEEEVETDYDEDENRRVASSSSTTTATTFAQQSKQRKKKAKKRNRSKKKHNLIQFGQVLLPPLPVRYSCGALCLMIEKGQLDLEPEYQRGVVWNVGKQSAVIDSMFRNCYVPPVLFSIHSVINDEGDDEELRICVDGKQRLSSIYNFMHNIIPIREPGSSRAFWFKHSKGKTRALTERQRERFSQLQINCVEYRGLNEEFERDMFQRVQMGITLTPAEKLSANLGQWPDFFRELIKRFIENDAMNLRHVIKMDRGKDFMYVGMICLLIIHCDDRQFVPLSSTVATFLKRNEYPPAETQKKQMVAAFARLTALANDDENNSPLLPIRMPGRQARTIAPVEFIFAGYLCFLFPQANNHQLSMIIDGMMRRVRGEHSDLMINLRNEATIRTYTKEMETLHPFLMSADCSNSARARRKRAREMDEEEYVPPVESSSAGRPRR